MPRAKCRHPLTKSEDVNSSSKLVSFLSHGVQVVTPYTIESEMEEKNISWSALFLADPYLFMLQAKLNPSMDI